MQLKHDAPTWPYYQMEELQGSRHVFFSSDPVQPGALRGFSKAPLKNLLSVARYNSVRGGVCERERETNRTHLVEQHEIWRAAVWRHRSEGEMYFFNSFASSQRSCIAMYKRGEKLSSGNSDSLLGFYGIKCLRQVNKCPCLGSRTNNICPLLSGMPNTEGYAFCMCILVFSKTLQCSYLFFGLTDRGSKVWSSIA